MAYIGQSLADGRLAAALASIYTVAPTVRGIVRSIDMSNRSATKQVVEVYILRNGSTARRIARFELLKDETAEVLSDGKVIVLSSSDAIQAFATTANAVDYVLTGAQESI